MDAVEEKRNKRKQFVLQLKYKIIIFSCVGEKESEEKKIKKWNGRRY